MKRTSMEHICSPPDEIIVSMVVHGTRIIVATNKNIYELIENDLEALELQLKKPVEV